MPEVAQADATKPQPFADTQFHEKQYIGNTETPLPVPQCGGP